MIGTFINVATILIGGTLGLLFGARVPERLKATVVAGMGLFTFAIGVQMFLKTENSLIVLGALLIGALLGEWWKIEDRLQSLGQILEVRFAKSDSTNIGGEVTSNKFVRGFLTASLLFCVGPLAILGSIQDGLTGNYNLLAVKSVLDGFASLAFASTLGVGVMFSSLMISYLSRRHQPACRSIECDRHAIHDERADRNRRRDLNGPGAQQFVGDQKNPRRKFSSHARDCPVDRLDSFVAWALTKLGGRSPAAQ